MMEPNNMQFGDYMFIICTSVTLHTLSWVTSPHTSDSCNENSIANISVFCAKLGEIPSDPLVRTPCFLTELMDLNHGQGSKIPQDARQGQREKKVQKFNLVNLNIIEYLEWFMHLETSHLVNRGGRRSYTKGKAFTGRNWMGQEGY